jgi:hypothetical protein
VLTQTRIARSENCNKSGAKVAWLLAGLQRLTVAEPVIWSRVQADAGERAMEVKRDGVVPKCWRAGRCGSRRRRGNVLLRACEAQWLWLSQVRGTLLARRPVWADAVEQANCW